MYTQIIKPEPLPVDWYYKDTVLAARLLLGKYLVRQYGDIFLMGEIVETEAYGYLNDPASHTFTGKSERNAPMFGPQGHAYVYISYGIHHCFNVVARSADAIAGGVLIRAIKPLIGIEQMRMHRGIDIVQRLAQGPGNLTKAFNITLAQKGALLTAPNLYIADGVTYADHVIGVSSRIGISKGQDLQNRFFLNDCPFVSGK